MSVAPSSAKSAADNANQSDQHLPAGNSETDLDLPALGAALWRKRRLIIIPTLLAALGAYAAVQLVTPKYSSETRIFIEGRGNVYLRPDADRTINDPTIDAEAVTSQAQIILSRDLAIEVIKKLNLGALPEFDPTLNGVSPLRSLLGLLGLTKDPLSMTHEERVLNSYYDRLSVSPLEKSRIINIDFLSSDPELAAKVANAIADAYLVRQREAQEDQARSASQWLAGQIETMRQKVEEAEAKVEDFRAKSNLLVGINNTTLSQQQLGDINAQLAASRALQADAEAKAKLIRDMLKSGKPIESSDVLNSELIRRLTEQRITLRAQLAEQSSTLLDNHPRIKELKAQIADLEAQIRSEAETIARSFENDAKLAGERVAQQTATLNQAKTQAASTNDQDVRLRGLERDAKSQRDLLESYLAKYREATSHDTLNSAPADARIISRATVSNIPAYPKKLPTILIATFAMLVMSSGLVVTREVLSAPGGFVPLRRDLSPIPDEAVPPARLDAVTGARNSTEIPLNDVADAADELQRTGVRRMAVFAAEPGVNVSQTVVKLARAMAEESRVILVGLASGETAIRAISNEPSAEGLAELAHGLASFRDIITKDRLSPLHLIAPGHASNDRLQILASRSVTIGFDALAHSYDHVIIDAGAAAGAGLDRIAEVAPHAVLIAETAASAAAARLRLLDAGIVDVTALTGTSIGAADTAAAA
ncbi:MAG TPA: exopolysaccharide transport family protein [Xanthobacteraceae bacterium]|nr:exopolysaccharide transport family protein [Xanthobacteraceae bacterium]